MVHNNEPTPGRSDSVRSVPGGAQPNSDSQALTDLGAVDLAIDELMRDLSTVENWIENIDSATFGECQTCGAGFDEFELVADPLVKSCGDVGRQCGTTSESPVAAEAPEHRAGG